MRSATRLVAVGEMVELRGPWSGGIRSRRAGEVLGADARGIRLRQTLHDYIGDTTNRTVIDEDGEWVPAADVLELTEKVVVVFWRNLSAVEVLQPEAVA